MTNKYPGKCASCGGYVAEGDGTAVRATSGWQVFCAQHAPQAASGPSQVSARPFQAVSGAPAQAASPAQARTLSVTGEVRMPYDPSALPLLRALPGARWNPALKAWTCSVGSADLPRTLEIAAQLHLQVAPELAARCVQTAQAQRAVDSRLFPFQVRGVDHLSRRPRALLGDEMGLGKTVQVLASLGEGWRVLVVCPASLKFNWVAEARKWAPSYRGTVLQGRDSFRWPEAGELVCVNYDVLPAGLVAREKGAAPEIAVPPGVTVVIDEAQFAKNYKAARSKRVQALCQGAQRVWALTGTPLSNKPLDLWGVLSNTGMSREVFGGWDRFTALYNARKNNWGGWDFGTPSVEVPERLRRVMLRRMRSEVMPDLPPKIWQTLECNGLPKALVARLDAMQRELLEEGWNTDELPPFSKFSELRQLLAESRIPAMLELVESYEESETPLVVFSAHRAPVDALAVRPGWVVITGDTPPAKRQQIVERFQAGDFRGIGITISAGGTGLTLTHAAHEIFVDLDWVPSNNAQAEDRCCRIGQTASSVQVTRLVSTHVLDRHVHDLLVAKIAMAYASVDAKAQVAAPEPPKARVRLAEVELPQYTPEQIVEILGKLQALAARCDGARAEDGQGFNRLDTEFGHSLASQVSLTQRQATVAERMVHRYHRQVGALSWRAESAEKGATK